jgi:hypothetical protein
MVVKNSDCTVYSMSRRGWMQKYRREKEGWIQTRSNGTGCPCNAEQLLSHLLPIMTGIKGPQFTVKVELDNKTAT